MKRIRVESQGKLSTNNTIMKIHVESRGKLPSNMTIRMIRVESQCKLSSNKIVRRIHVESQDKLSSNKTIIMRIGGRILKRSKYGQRPDTLDLENVEVINVRDCFLPQKEV